MIKKQRVVLALLLLAAAGPSHAAEVKDQKPVEAAFRGAVSSLQAQPAETPEEAVVSVLKYMRGAVRYQPGLPEPRGPHEWSGRVALANGSVNGCVESAKVFFELFRAAFPKYKAVYLDSFNAAGDGGHAVVGVTGTDGNAFIVDATAFTRLPGPASVDESSLSGPVGIRPEYTGRILQFRGSADVFTGKKDGKYLMKVYPYGEVFDGPVRSERSFGTLEELNGALAGFPAQLTNFRYLQDNGFILPYVDPERTGFLYAGSSSPLSKHVIYGCYTILPDRDDAEKIEPAARENYAKTGKAGTCDWSRTK